jgi:hypothetical protein
MSGGGLALTLHQLRQNEPQWRPRPPSGQCTDSVESVVEAPVEVEASGGVEVEVEVA